MSHRRSWYGITTPFFFFSNFLFAYLFSIKFLYFFIISALFSYFNFYIKQSGYMYKTNFYMTNDNVIPITESPGNVGLGLFYGV